MTEQPSLELSIVLPTFKERENLSVFIPKIQNAFQGLSFEMIIVDDGSADGTRELIHQMNQNYKNLRLIERSKMMGIGSAIREGYNQSQGRFVLSSDADQSFLVEDMKALYQKILEGYDLVVGYRHGGQAYYEAKTWTTKLKHFVSSKGNWIVRNLSGIKLHDFSANFRIIQREKWMELKTQENTNSLLFEMIVKASKKNFKMTQIPVRFQERKFGSSKLNLWKEAPKFLIKFIQYSFFS